MLMQRATLRLLLSPILLMSWATLPGLASAPQVITWEQLRDVQFRKRWYPAESIVMLVPKFGPSVRALQGKTVAVTGYVIPLDLENGLYVVSRYPMAQCFFCGGAGPESIIALKFSRLPRRFNTDERHTFSGRLRLNADDIYEMNYILDNAELLPGTPR
jgi:hypothetical protein